MEIDSLDDLGADLRKRIDAAHFAIQGPQHFEWGYGWSPNITFWTDDRRVHFFFESIQGRVYVIVECAEVSPRKAVVSRIETADDAFLILSQFLRKRCAFEDLPGDEWLSDVPTHDEQVPHPPDKGQEQKAPSHEAPRDRGAEGRSGTTPSPGIQLTGARLAPAEGKVTGLVFYSNDPARLAQWYADNLGARAGQLGSMLISFQKSENRVSGGSVMFTYAVSNFDTFVADLMGRGAELLGLDENKLGKFAYTRDPDGNLIEIWGK